MEELIMGGLRVLALALRWLAKELFVDTLIRGLGYGVLRLGVSKEKLEFDSWGVLISGFVVFLGILFVLKVVFFLPA